ncbi:Histidine kinase [Hyphomicrobiales bacterium]|nr:Histidine kinase [Hyphomicrobiales bacterium]CAH1669864.1 Histidine kinase [Hyphomicrobiales bacterium]
MERGAPIERVTIVTALISGLSMRQRLASLIHPSVGEDEDERARHEHFIVTRLIVAFVALTALPLYLAVFGVPSLAQLLVLIFLAAPIGAVVLLSRTGRLDVAYGLSSASFALLVLVLATASGGTTSPALICLVALPVEALLSGSTRLVLASSFMGVVAAFTVAVLQALGFVQAGGVQPGLMMPLCASAAIGYVATQALAACRREAKDRAVIAQHDARDQVVLETIGDLVTWHDRSGSVVFVSAAAEVLTGLPAQRLYGRGLFDLVHIADRPAFIKTLTDAVFCTGPLTTQFRLNVASPDPETGAASTGFIWVEMTVKRAQNPAGELLDDTYAVVAVTRDITPLKQHEAELDEALSQAESANEAKSRFLATVSHELRTPLNAIIGFSEILASPALSPHDQARQREYAMIVQNSGRHLLEMVNMLLDMSRIEAGNFEIEFEPFDASALLDDCCDLMQLKAKDAEIVLGRQFERNDHVLVADQRACRQIVLNLIANAVKFTPPGGEVRVSAKVEGERFVLRVADTGIGIAEEDIPRLGSPFFQARSSYDRPYEGTGLGLSVVNGLVSLHHGTIDIASVAGKGTTVTVSLPQDCRAGAEAQPTRHRLDIGLSMPWANRRKDDHEKEAMKRRA